MKKRIVCLFVAIVAAFAQTSLAFADNMPDALENRQNSVQLASESGTIVQPRYENIFLIIPSFVVEDDIASCALDIECLYSTASVKANIVLYKETSSGRSKIGSWTARGTGSINWSKDVSVSYGKYIMSVTVTSGSDYYFDEFTRTY